MVANHLGRGLIVQRLGANRPETGGESSGANCLWGELSEPFNWFYSLCFTADPDLNQDSASFRCCLYKWSLHEALAKRSRK